MTVETKYNDGGSWRLMSNIYYKDGSTWRDLTHVYYNDGGVWRTVFQAVPPAVVLITNQSVDAIGTVTGAGYRLNSSGDAEHDAGVGSWTGISGEWLLSGAAADYECRFVENSGTVTSGSVSVWLNCGTTRTWTVEASVGLTKTCVGTLSIRDVATSTVQDTAQITLFHDNA